MKGKEITHTSEVSTSLRSASPSPPPPPFPLLPLSSISCTNPHVTKHQNQSNLDRLAPGLTTRDHRPPLRRRSTTPAARGRDAPGARRGSRRDGRCGGRRSRRRRRRRGPRPSWGPCPPAPAPWLRAGRVWQGEVVAAEETLAQGGPTRCDRARRWAGLVEREGGRGEGKRRGGTYVAAGEESRSARATCVRGGGKEHDTPRVFSRWRRSSIVRQVN